MRISCTFIHSVLIGLFCLFPINGFGDQEITQEVIRSWYDADKFPKMGIEVELSNLTQAEVSKALHRLLGGNVQIKVNEASDGAKVKIYKHKATEIGSFRVIVDDNSSSQSKSQLKNQVIEIVTAPFESASQLSGLHRALLHLKKLSARGIEGGVPVAIHINIQMGDGSRSLKNFEVLLNFLRSYFEPSNRFVIDQFMNIPKIREPYLGQYSPKMMERILTPSYSPSPVEFFNDFLIRQSLELNGVREAWTMSLESAEAALKARIDKIGIEAVLPVVKWNHVRISSYLVFLNPTHWLSQYLVRSYWVKPLPIIEVREPSNRFNLAEVGRFIGGIYQKSLAQGSFDLVSKRDGILDSDRRRLQEAQKTAGDRPWVVRTMYYDGINDPHKDPVNQSYLRQYTTRNSTLIFVNGNDIPKTPLKLKGESVVFHNLPELQEILVGKYNPGLANQYVGQFLEHKFHEALFWERYAKGAMASTKPMSAFVEPGITPMDLKKRLDRAFPEGWVLKGAIESATQEQFVITEKDDFRKELKIYGERFADFQRLRERALEKGSGNNPDIVARNIREHPAFKGWRIKRFMKYADDAIVQSRLEIVAEYRVEAVGGKILGGLSTIPRYQYEIPESDSWRNVEEISRVEKFAMEILSSLPRSLQATPFAFDIAVTRDGSIKLIESNPMSNSGFLIYDKRGVKELNKFLHSYPELVRNGEIPTPLEVARQFEYIADFMEIYKLKADHHKFPFLKTNKSSRSNFKEGLMCQKIFSL